MIRSLVKYDQRGGASLFIVLFFTLLIGVITLSFVTIVNQDERQSTNNDLSRSAYDSAQAGVEDSRRLLRQYNECIAGQAACNDLAKYEAHLNKEDCNAINNPDMRTLLGLVGTGDDKGVEVKSRGGDDLQQAYTCVNVATDVPDYMNTLNANQSDLIPLQTKDDAPFQEVQIAWFKPEDIYGAGTIPNGKYSFFNFPRFAANASEWGENTPAALRIQVIKKPRADKIALTNLNRDSRAVFLYPQKQVSSTITGTSINFPDGDPGRSGSAGETTYTKISAPKSVGCNENITPSLGSSDGFSCRFALTGVDYGYNYYLRITPAYRKTTFSVSLKDVSNPANPQTVKFHNVQTIVDSTGRANDVYRRVQTRLNPYNPNETSFDLGISSTNSICKDFGVAAIKDDYESSSCPIEP